MVEVEVMYADRSRQRVPLDQADTLPKDDVLFIILSASTTSERGRRTIGGVPYERIAEMKAHGGAWKGASTYAVMRLNGKVTIAGWDDTEWLWRDEADPFAEQPRAGIPPIFPPDTILFYGAILPDAEWPAAVALFNAEMH